MTIEPRYLITTADERTWKFDRPVIFLGEWCLHYNRKHIWQDMNAIIAEPYGLGQECKDADRIEARDIERFLFPVFIEVLNQHHGTQHSLRYWRIVLGHWFRCHIELVLNRVKTIEQCLSKYKINKTTVLSGEKYHLAPLDSLAGIWAVNNDRWNNGLYDRILKLIDIGNISVDVVTEDGLEGFWMPTTTIKANLNRMILRWGYRHIGKALRFFAKKNDAFISTTYLPRIDEIKLQLALGQFPQVWNTPKLKLDARPDRVLRYGLTEKVGRETGGNLSNIVASLIFELLPVCYLEGFVEVSDRACKLPFIQKPKFIFISNRFSTDEIFKIWVAGKVEQGAKYFIGQHGNNYGVSKNEGNKTIEEITPDRFLTWGWKGDLTQHIEAFMLKTRPKKKSSYNRNGNLLLVEEHMHHRLTTYDCAYEFGIYFDEQKKFVADLNPEIKNKLIVRLFAPWRLSTYFENLRWRDFDSSVVVDEGDSSMELLIANSRLIVQSYDSTGLLEMLSRNIPTIAFWQCRLDHLKESAIPFYQSLVDVGVIHFTPESAANKINEIWNDIDHWWFQDIVQDARRKFCDRYANISSDIVQDLKELFEKQ